FDLPPWFFVSVADKGVRVFVSGLESTDTDGFVSVDSKRVGHRCGGGSGGERNGERVPAWRVLRERERSYWEPVWRDSGEILRSGRGDSRGKQVWGGRWGFVAIALKPEMGRELKWVE